MTITSKESTKIPSKGNDIGTAAGVKEEPLASADVPREATTTVADLTRLKGVNTLSETKLEVDEAEGTVSLEINPADVGHDNQAEAQGTGNVGFPVRPL